MRLDEPRWWYDDAERMPWQVRVLRPAAQIYGRMVERRFLTTDPYRSRLPVLCVGNLTAGGTGKTPLSAMIVARLAGMGQRPVILSRGYGGKLEGPVLVDAGRHSSRDVGDEPLLLARSASVVIARDRKAGATFIESGAVDASIIVMDDGLQNASLKKDLTLAVIDGVRGIGNGEVMPAGPLRAPLKFQLGMVDCIVANGAQPDGHHYRRFKQEFPGPVLSASVVPIGDVSWVRGTRILAYAGIGHPARFYSLLRDLGATIIDAVTFPDHHAFSGDDAERLLQAAKLASATLVTTEKDFVRLDRASERCRELAEASRTLAVALEMPAHDAARLDALLESVVRSQLRG